ncbi:cell wall-binding repeat-containing protein [Clostridium sp. LBM24168]
MKNILSLVITLSIILGGVSSVFAKDTFNIERLWGNNRYSTSVKIASKFSPDKLQNVILASGDNFQDALSGSVLSKKLNAPILLTGSTLESSSDAINYIKQNLDKSGTVYVIGGSASVSKDVCNRITGLGYSIKRISGSNKFATDSEVIKTLDIASGTPVVIANSSVFADALSISSIATMKGYPIILSSSGYLSDEMSQSIKNIQPSKVYVIGGEGSITSNVVSQIRGLVSALKDDDIIRIGGLDRYETSLNICKYFNIKTDTAVLANGENFPDALSGSALAAKLSAPIVLTNGQNINNQKEYMRNAKYSKLMILGGEGAIKESCANILNDKAVEIPSTNENMSDYMEKGEWYYYQDSTGSIYKVKTDGTKTVLVSKCEPSSDPTQKCYRWLLTVRDGWVYYKDVWGDPKYMQSVGKNNELHRVKTDGTSDTVILSAEVINGGTIIGDWIYYNDLDNFYRIRLDGTDNALVEDNMDASNVVSDGSHIYYSNGHYTLNSSSETDTTEPTKHSIYKCNLDGSDKEELITDVDRNPIIEGYDVKTNVLYYYYQKVIGSSDEFLYSMNTDGSNSKLFFNGINDMNGVSVTIGNGYLYIPYSRLIQGGRIFKVKSDGTETVTLNSPVLVLNLAAYGDWLYYKGGDNGVYKMKTDGTGFSKIK